MRPLLVFAAVAGALVLAGLCWLPRAEGALPPGYGGTLVLPAPHPLRLPNPRQPSSAFEADLGHALYDGLYAFGPQRAPVPVLAAGPPRWTDAGIRVPLRVGLRRHDGRTLTARDVAAALRRVHARPAGLWLVGLSAEDDAIAALGDDALLLRFPRRMSPRAVAYVLAAAPLVLAFGPSERVGTGPFRARLQGPELVLRGYRHAARGAPYLDRIVLRRVTDPAEELRAFELGSFQASWRGAGLYARGPTTAHALAPGPLVVLAGAPPPAPLDRSRLRRVGIEPREAIGNLPAPARRASARPGRFRIRSEPGSPIAAEIAQALVAQLESAGLSAAHVTRGPAEATLLLVPPPRPDPASTLAATYAALGDTDQAEQVLEAALDGDAEALGAAARALEVTVLGTAPRTLFARGGFAGVRSDALGRLRLGGLHVPRERTP